MAPQRNAFMRVPVEARRLGRRLSQSRRQVSQPEFGAALLETERHRPTDTLYLKAQLLDHANVI